LRTRTRCPSRKRGPFGRHYGIPAYSFPRPPRRAARCVDAGLGIRGLRRLARPVTSSDIRVNRTEERHSVGEHPAVGPEEPVAAGRWGGGHPVDRAVEGERSGRSGERCVVGENSAIRGHQPVSAGGKIRGDGDHRLVLCLDVRGPHESGVPERDYPAVCRHQPVAPAIKSRGEVGAGGDRQAVGPGVLLLARRGHGVEQVESPPHAKTPRAFWVANWCHAGGDGRAEAPKGNPGHGTHPLAGDPDELHSTWV
jgi:hypothetical protein